MWLPKFSHSILSKQISGLCVDGREQTHNYHLQLFKYCNMRSLDGTKSVCNKTTGKHRPAEHWAHRRGPPSAIHRPPSPASRYSTLIQTHRILFVVRSATLLSLYSEKLSHMQNTCCLSKHGNQEVWGEALSAWAMRRMKTSRWWSPNRRFIKRKSDTINILSPWKNKSAPVPLFALLCHFLTRCWLIHSSSHWHFSV